MKIQNRSVSTPSFGRFTKIKGSHSQLQKFKSELREEFDEILPLLVKKDKKKSFLYVMSGKHLDRFLDLTKTVYFRDLRTNLEFYMPFKVKNIKLKTAQEKLEHKKLKV